ncbi:polysaccharide biosynthesis/export family protein [Pseudomonadota bacterium]
MSEQLKFGAALNISIVLLIIGLATGCRSTPLAQETIDQQRAAQERASQDRFNNELAAIAIQTSQRDRLLEQEYPVGPGDVLDIAVFQVEELNTTARVNAKGTIILPLLGELEVGGKALRDVEALLDERLLAFMHEPQVSVFVAEYQSQQISVTGAVTQPALHTITRPRTVLELLSMSGGLTDTAGRKIYVHTSIRSEPQRLIIDLDEVLRNPDDLTLTIALRGGDSIFVPEAGVVFIEDAVKNPGSYKLTGNTGLMEAIALAGGIKYEAKETIVQVYTLVAGKEPQVINIDMDALRANTAPGITLKDGDIVVVPTSALKAGLAVTARGIGSIFRVGFTP